MGPPHLNKNGEICTCGFSKGQPRIASGGWQPGEWGKGLYWPETGHVQVWPEPGPGHFEVQMNDETQMGPAHHLDINPKGEATNTGAYGRDTKPVEGDSEGLAQALQEYNPPLRLGRQAWDFKDLDGPTEPTPEEPEHEDEEGHHHGIQFRDDYMGGG